MFKRFIYTFLTMMLLVSVTIGASAAELTQEEIAAILAATAQAQATASASPVIDPNFQFKWDVKGIENQPYLVCVNRAMCTTTVYGKDSAGNYTIPVKAFVCSVGRKGHGTPTGRYKTGTNRYEWRLMVDGTYARYAIGIYKGIMFHSVPYFKPSIDKLEYEEYNKLGSPASLGCIRMSIADEYWIWANCPVGFTTVIYDDTTCPGPIGKPVPLTIDVNDVVNRNYDPTEEEYNKMLAGWKLLNGKA